MKKCIMLFLESVENLKIPKCYTFLKKTLVSSTTYCKFKNEDEKIFKEQESIWFKWKHIITLRIWSRKT